MRKLSPFIKTRRPAPWLLCLIALAAALAPMVNHAGNPIFQPNRGVTDPHIKIFNNKAYMYASHDYSIDNTKFDMRDWMIWSSEDLKTWRYEMTLKPEDTYIGPSKTCWAGDAIEKDGLYYWYLSQTPTKIAVMVGDTPIGPWRDILKKPLIDEDLTSTRERDPAVFKDDNGEYYILFGVWDFYIAKLGDDMVSLAETPKKIELSHLVGPYGGGKTDDKVDIHKYNGKYYLSWGAFYAMSDHLYGPYETKGAFIQEAQVAPDFRDGKITHDRHGKFFEWGGQWYFAGNDKSQPDSHDRFRNSFISYVFYEPNGEIKPIVINRKGVEYPSPHIQSTKK